MCRVASSLQDVAFSRRGLLACRLFISTFESLFGTGSVCYPSLPYDLTAMSWVFFVSWFIDPTAVAG